MSDLANITAAANRRVCELGRADHGHTDCWIIGGLLNEIERLTKENANMLIKWNEAVELGDAIVAAMNHPRFISTPDLRAAKDAWENR